MRKKKIVFHSNFCGSKTGFGRNAREVLTGLYNTGKYDIVEYAAGLKWSDPAAKRTPWPVFGTWPDNDQEIAHLQNHPAKDAMFRQVTYGAHNIDKIILQEKPDVYIGAEDIWAFYGYWHKKWWNKITSVIHTTLDSLPILEQATEAAKETKNFLVWAKFAEEAMQKLGHKHVRTVHGAIDTKKFFRLPELARRELREKNKIPLDSFVIGFVFRNQLRKSAPNLIEGFKAFQRQHPEAKAKLLLHTHWEEMEQGWDIPRLLKENGVDQSDVLTTYVCRACGDYEVKPFSGFDADCGICGCKHNPRPTKYEERTCQATASIHFGVSEKQLNEVYNLMSVYVHPFTSGGQEIPVQEAKLAELVTLVTNYACGTEYCTSESGGMPLEWAPYREHGTQFIKASTYASSISKQLSRVFKMPKDKNREMGRAAREFVVNSCGSQNVTKAFEAIIDEAPYTDWDFNIEEPLCDLNFPVPEIEDNVEWITSLYRGILKREPDTQGLETWVADLEKGRPRVHPSNGVYNFFIEEGRAANERNYPIKLEDFLEDTGRGKVVMVMPQSMGDCFLLTSLFPSFKENYPDKDLYICTKQEYFEIFDANEYVFKCIPYAPIMENELFLIGQGNHKGYFDVAFLPHILTQRQLNYLRNGQDKIAFNIRK
jgi:glycosyltransferase involved in cell wall biosynthesis